VAVIYSDNSMDLMFDSQGRPTVHVTSTGDWITITYTDNGFTEHFQNGDSVTFQGFGPNAVPVSITTAGGETIYFAVEIPKLGAAIPKMIGYTLEVESGIAGLRQLFTTIGDVDWQSNSGRVWSSELVPSFNHSADQLIALLQDAVARMQSSSATYVGTEGTNVNNFTAVSSRLAGANSQPTGGA
jgi:hypothetical protein